MTAGRRRAAGSPGPAPVPARKLSPGQSSSIAVTSSTSYNYNLHQTTNGHGQDYHSAGPDYRSAGPKYRSPSPYGPPSDGPRHSSPSPSGQRAPLDGTPTGVSYYSSNHSTHSHQWQKSGSGPMAFPTGSASPHHGSHQGAVQSPPKRVDELMSELADFDPSIRPSDIAEPEPSRSRSHHHESHAATDRYQEDDYPRRRRRSLSPVHPTKQASTPGPPVYYPPGMDFYESPFQPESF
jgi:hypothetical protein